MASTVRVHELAKELNLSSKETIALLSKVGIRASTHMSVIDEHRARIVKGVLLGNLAQAAKAHKPAAKSATGNGSAAAAAAKQAVAAEAVAPAGPATAPAREARPQPQAPATVAAASAAPPAGAVAEAPAPVLKPVPSGQRSAVRPAPAHKVIPAASASPSTPVPTQARTATAPVRQAPPGRPLGAPPAPGLGPNMRPPLRRDGIAPGRPLPGRVPGRPLPGRPGMGPGGPLPTTGPAPSTGGRKRSREDLERDRKEREREELLKKNQPRHKGASVATPTAEPVVFKDLEIPDLITVQQLAAAMSLPAGQVIAQLIRTGTMATINQHIAPDVASQVARRFGFNTIVKEAGEEAAEIVVESDPAGSLTPRPPWSPCWGTSITARRRCSTGSRHRTWPEAKRRHHAAHPRLHGREGRPQSHFRRYARSRSVHRDAARGAKVTDIAVLVVAADDGVMPQTNEAIESRTRRSVPIVVAVNKIDKPNANVDRVKQQLSEYGLTPEDWGGTTQFIPVSAKQRRASTRLLEMVLLKADLLELQGQQESPRARRDHRGATRSRRADRWRPVLVKNGTLRVGDIVVVGATWGRVRALFDDKLQAIKRAGPAIPAEIMGLSDVPAAGDILEVVSDERDARELAAKRSQRKREQRMASARRPVTLEAFWRKPKKAVSAISTSSSARMRKARSRRCAPSSMGSPMKKSAPA